MTNEMKTTFTPGPWQIGGRSKSGSLFISDLQDEPIDFWIDANAHLAAAAPDLFAACQLLIKAYGNFNIHSGHSSTCECGINQAADAIAKATP